MRPDLHMTLAFRPRENHATLPTAPADPSLRLSRSFYGILPAQFRKMSFLATLTFLANR